MGPHASTGSSAHTHALNLLVPMQIEPTMQTWLHRWRQTAMKGTVDPHGPHACSLVAFELGQHKDKVLSQVPECFHVLGEADALARAADQFAGIGFEQQKHAGPDVLESMLTSPALDEAWKREQSK